MNLELIQQKLEELGYYTKLRKDKLSSWLQCRSPFTENSLDDVIGFGIQKEGSGFRIRDANYQTSSGIFFDSFDDLFRYIQTELSFEEKEGQ